MSYSLLKEIYSSMTTAKISDIKTAQMELESLKRKGFEVPKEITPEYYMQSVNEVIRRHNA